MRARPTPTGIPFGGGTSDQPYLFYSRRIGLNRNRVVPLDVGGRVTGKLGGYGIGIMNIQAGDEDGSATPSTNVTVVRLKRDILRRSTVGVIATNRSQSSVTAGGSNQAYGVDAALGFYQNVNLSGYYARTKTTGLGGDNESYQLKFDYPADRYGLRAEHLKVGRAFNPEVGFLRRTDFERSFASARFSPRPRSIRRIRKFTFEGSLEHFESGAGEVESRQQTGRFNTEFDNSDQFSVEANASYDRLVAPFQPAAGVTLPIGSYDYNERDRVLLRRAAAAGVRDAVIPGGAVLRRDHSRADLLDRPGRDSPTAFGRAELFDQPRGIAGGGLYHRRLPGPNRLRPLAADVCERAAPIQLRRSHLQQQSALSLGIPAGQRLLCRLDRRAGHSAGSRRRVAQNTRSW